MPNTTATRKRNHTGSLLRDGRMDGRRPFVEVPPVPHQNTRNQSTLLLEEGEVAASHFQQNIEVPRVSPAGNNQHFHAVLPRNQPRFQHSFSQLSQNLTANVDNAINYGEEYVQYLEQQLQALQSAIYVPPYTARREYNTHNPNQVVFPPTVFNQSRVSSMEDPRNTIPSISTQLQTLELDGNRWYPQVLTREPHASKTTLPLSISPLPVSKIPTIGVFWDIENCSVPRGKSALLVVHRIRSRFFGSYVEAEFTCVCDIRKESPQIIQELNDAQVNVVHVSGTSKNAADDKLRQAMRRYADAHSATSGSFVSADHRRAALVLISGDVNFASDLSDIRHRKLLHIILLHNKQTHDALLACAHECYEFYAGIDTVPFRSNGNSRALPQHTLITTNSTSVAVPEPKTVQSDEPGFDVSIVGLSGEPNQMKRVKMRLKRLSDNCGGKVQSVEGNQAVIRFKNREVAQRAAKRMEGEDVCGSKITVKFLGFNKHIPPVLTKRNPQVLPNTTNQAEPSSTQTSRYRNKERRQQETTMDQFPAPETVIKTEDGIACRVWDMWNSTYKIQQASNSPMREPPIVVAAGITKVEDPQFNEEKTSLPVENEVKNESEKFQQPTTSETPQFLAVREEPESLEVEPSLLEEETEISTCRISKSEPLASVTSTSNSKANLFVNSPLNVFTDRAKQILEGYSELSIIDFVGIYEAKFASLLCNESNLFQVPLEHLLTAIPSFEITRSEVVGEYSRISKKPLQIDEKKSRSGKVLSVGAELRILLSTIPGCLLPIVQFEDSYKKYFGRKFSCSGFTNLYDLFNTMNGSTVQVLGQKPDIYVTLTHETQLKRFTVDVLRILKGEPTNEILRQDFNECYQKVFHGRIFIPSNYGLCSLEDLITEVLRRTSYILCKEKDGKCFICLSRGISFT